MKRLPIILAALLFSATAVVAQPHGTHGGGHRGPPSAEHHQEMLDHLTKALSLTDAQRAGLEKIHAARMPALEPLLARQAKLHDQVEAALERGASAATVGNLVIAAYKVRKQVEALHTEMIGEAAKVLDADQMTKLRAMMERHGPGH
jgi:Spy/CpxP family protein refolding chaperone